MGNIVNKAKSAKNADNTKKNKPKEEFSLLTAVYDLIEMAGVTTISVMILFIFIMRLNVVEGISMQNTLHEGEYLAVSGLFYTPSRGDIVIVHDISASPYDEPIVKRVIGLSGDKIEIDFAKWELKVNGSVVDEPYRYIDLSVPTLMAEYNMNDTQFTIEVPEGSIFVMGDNRSHSADSRQIEIGPVDRRCVVGKAIVRISPLDKFTLFKSPYAE